MFPYYDLHEATQRLVLAAAAGQARHLSLPEPSLARGAYPEAAKPLSAANGVGQPLFRRLLSHNSKQTIFRLDYIKGKLTKQLNVLETCFFK